MSKKYFVGRKAFSLISSHSCQTLSKVYETSRNTHEQYFFFSKERKPNCVFGIMLFEKMYGKILLRISLSTIFAKRAKDS
jgi:hypothetical protein